MCSHFGRFVNSTRSSCESSISSEGMKDIRGMGGGGCHRFADTLKNYTLAAIKYEM